MGTKEETGEEGKRENSILDREQIKARIRAIKASCTEHSCSLPDALA